ncbi:MAG: Xaa-Pro peptidase family protein [Spirochaetaceae bacterium]|jgi:Xaa-Pro dipeptidase|nr:Xaa-Pro peptidase family protein [Spirochaetaceae bacterium]
MSVFQNRRERIYDWMAGEGIALVMLEDTEGRRDPGIRWLTGQPGDALLFLTADKQSLLVPWDINLAKLYANADIMIPYGEFERNPITAIKTTADYCKVPLQSRIEIPSDMPYTIFLKYVEALSDFDVLCRDEGIKKMIQEQRAVKDDEEIRIYRRAAAITNELIDLLEEQIRGEKLRTETDVALFIEAEGRRRDCEGTGFETLAASPARSFGIHAFPAYTGAPFIGPGLSILDFGLNYSGYTTDVTLTFALGPLSAAQEKRLSLVEKAYKLALSLAGSGAGARDIAAAVDGFFGKSRKVMPHALGHGIGLEAHEAPALRNRADNDTLLVPGMIFTLEPGLYDPVQGGCRLENDVLITDTGVEVLTTARIIRL